MLAFVWKENVMNASILGGKLVFGKTMVSERRAKKDEVCTCCGGLIQSDTLYREILMYIEAGCKAYIRKTYHLPLCPRDLEVRR
ncbi:MAG: hypothetical protein AAB392_00060 [Patescibacteria group bacterium]